MLAYAAVHRVLVGELIRLVYHKISDLQDQDSYGFRPAAKLLLMQERHMSTLSPAFQGVW